LLEQPPYVDPTPLSVLSRLSGPVAYVVSVVTCRIKVDDPHLGGVGEEVGCDLPRRLPARGVTVKKDTHAPAGEPPGPRAPPPVRARDGHRGEIERAGRYGIGFSLDDPQLLSRDGFGYREQLAARTGVGPQLRPTVATVRVRLPAEMAH
jgi:hypothetical protein